MAEEVKTEEKKTEPQPTGDVKPKEVEVKPEEKKEVKLPEKDFFTGDTMNKWIEESGLGEEEPPEIKPEVKLEEGEELCPECPEGKRKIEPSKGKEERKPYKILKVDGKDVPVYSEEEHDALAQKGFHYTQERQKDAEWERGLEAREKVFDKRLKEVSGPIQQLVDLLGTKKGAELVEKITEGEKEPELGEDIEPEIKDALKKRDAKIEILEEKLGRQEETSAKRSFQEASETLNTLVEKARQDHPFDDIVNEESKESVSQKLFAGLISSKLNDDKIKKQLDESFEVRKLPEIITESAQDLHRMEEHYKAKFGSDSKGELPAEATTEQLIEKYPEQVKTLAQNAVAAYLKEQEGKAPTIKSETTVEAKTPEGKKKFKSLDDAFEKAKESPIMEEAMKELAALPK